MKRACTYIFKEGALNFRRQYIQTSKYLKKTTGTGIFENQVIFGFRYLNIVVYM